MARSSINKQGWIGWVFFTDLLGGLRLTLRYMFSKTITHHYPDVEKWVPYTRHRGHHFINTNDEGDPNCVACELCSRICPCNCITVVPFEDAKGNRRPKVFNINLARCLYCGLCEDACPANAIKLGQEYEISNTRSSDLVVHLDELMLAPRKSENGGQVMAAKLMKDGTQRSVTTGKDGGFDWWERINRNE